MPWKEKTKAMLREEFIREYREQQETLTALCRKYSISRPTAYKWIERFENGEGLEDRSREPFHKPRKTAEKTEQQIVQKRLQYPTLGAVKLKRVLEDETGEKMPAASTINNILAKNGLISKEASEKAKHYVRFEKSSPNEMWQADFKGDYAMLDGVRCHTLNIIDDHSRFNLCTEALQGESFAVVQPVVIRLFEEFGMPEVFQCDNGNPWGNAQHTGFTRFEVWLMEHGVLPCHSRIHHPQTQGKEERYNGILTQELLKRTTIADFEDAQRKYDEFRDFYNNVRPHHALGLDTPAAHYSPSVRAYSPDVNDWEYEGGAVLRQVRGNGYISFKGNGYFLSEAFADRKVCIKEREDGKLTVIFRQFKVAVIDPVKHEFLYRRAYMLHNDPRSAAPEQ